LIGPTPGAMLCSVDSGEPRERIQNATLELALALGSLLVVGTVAFRVAPWLASWVPQAWARALGFVAGPAVTAGAALIYRFTARALDTLAGPTGAKHAEISSLSRAPGMALAAVVAGVFAALGGSFLLSQLMLLLGLPVEEQAGILEIIAQAKASGVWFEVGVLAFSAIVLAPCAEEWLFRRQLFVRLAERTGWIEAYALSAAAFALIHGNLAGLVIYLWLGVVFAATYWASGRLWTAIVVHALNNLLALLGLLFFDP